MATVIGLNRYSLIALRNTKPTAAAGTNATAKFSTKRFTAASRPKPETTFAKRCRYSTTTANTAPSWMAISNTLPWLEKFSKSPSTIKCPVLEMGRNSVKPSIMPKIRAFSNTAISIIDIPSIRQHKESSLHFLNPQSAGCFVQDYRVTADFNKLAPKLRVGFGAGRGAGIPRSWRTLAISSSTVFMPAS